MTNTELTPKTANTFNKLCKLKRDNLHTSKSWILVEENSVSIRNQKSGEESTGNITLTKKEMDWQRIH